MSTRIGDCCSVVASMLQGCSDGARNQVGTVEAVVYEFNMNFDDLDSGMVQARFNAILSIAGAPYNPGTATYNLRVGAATPNVVGGTVVATLTTASTAEVLASILGASFSNPGGQQLVQVTAFHSDPGGKAQIRGLSFVIG